MANQNFHLARPCCKMTLRESAIPEKKNIWHPTGAKFHTIVGHHLNPIQRADHFFSPLPYAPFARHRTSFPSRSIERPDVFSESQ